MSLKRALRVLIVEDDENDALLLARELERGGYSLSWRRVAAMGDMRLALDADAWDLVISDYNMPGFSAAEAIALVRKRRLDAPIIILSGSIGEEEAVSVMRSGASDYIQKGSTARLLPAVERELRESGLRRKAREVEEQLRQAQKMEAVGRLAGGVAHDFNNILTAILGNCELLVQALGDENPLRLGVQDIMESGLRAAALTRQLLTFSRKEILQPRVLDLNAVVLGVEKLLRRLIGEDVELAIDLERELGLIMADPGQMEQVIMNLAVNARDAMPNGGKLTIATRNAAFEPAAAVDGFDFAPGACVELAVADDGCGIPAEARARLFEPFFTTKEPGKGTGLGLSMVYGIVKQNSGAIAVKSEPGRGAAFRIFLPLVKTPPPANGAASVPPRSLRGSETLLLVEDDHALRGTVARMLAGFGYDVLVASGWESALQESSRHSGAIHMLLTDVIMPGLDGVAVSRKIQETRPGIKVLFLSGYANSVIAPKGILDPGVQLLIKPFTMDALGRKVREVLDADPTFKE